MQAITVTADIFGFIVLLVILCGSVIGHYSRERTAVLFRISLIVTLVGTAVDVVSYLLEDVNDGFVSAMIVSVLSYILCYVMLVFFALYMVSLIEQKAPVPRWGLIPFFIGIIVNMFLISVGAFSGNSLLVVDGHVTEGPWAEAANSVTFLCVLYLYYILFCYKKILGSSQVFAIGGFLLFPIVDAWITIFTELDFTYPVDAIAFLIIYVIIQEQTDIEDKVKEHV